MQMLRFKLTPSRREHINKETDPNTSRESITWYNLRDLLTNFPKRDVDTIAMNGKLPPITQMSSFGSLFILTRSPMKVSIVFMITPAQQKAAVQREKPLNENRVLIRGQVWSCVVLFLCLLGVRGAKANGLLFGNEGGDAIGSVPTEPYSHCSDIWHETGDNECASRSGLASDFISGGVKSLLFRFDLCRLFLRLCFWSFLSRLMWSILDKRWMGASSTINTTSTNAKTESKLISWK